MFVVKDFLMNEAGDAGSDSGSAPTTQATTETQSTEQKTPETTQTDAGQSGSEVNTNQANFNSGTWDEEGEQSTTEPKKEPEAVAEYNHDEAYKDFEFKLKDGYSLSDEEKASYLEMAKEKGVKPEQMQTFIDKHIEANESHLNQYRETVKQWDNEVRNDPVLGGDNFPQTKQNLNRALNGKIEGGKEVRQLLAETGLISNPAMVKFLNNLGKIVTDGKVVTGGEVKSGNDYNAMYPNTQFKY